ncbi:MAG: membrane protein insertase YidC, partial [Geminicoccaceae bacterium]|nr:membrane protein insertase YidC [Geminicoccaceae bacterium]
MTDQRNLILAIVISVGIILGFQVFYEMPRMERQQQLTESQDTGQGSEGVVPPSPTSSGAASGGAPASSAGVGAALDPNAGLATSRAEALARLPRVQIANGRVHGSLALDGVRFDDVTLVDYRQTVDPNSPEIELLNPVGARDTYFAEFGWVPEGEIVVPNAETLWEQVGDKLTQEVPVEFRWDNGQGLLFAKQVAVDENFMFTLARSVTNNSDQPVTLFPYGLVSRWGTPKTSGYYILHEGP